MRTRNFQQMEFSETKATGSHGNHNWLLWQQSLYMNMSSSKTDAEKILFGLLCNDSSYSKHNQDIPFEESLYYHFRSYLNNEVMRRYIVVRKILQKHRKLVLFNEPSSVESKFDNLNPVEILRFIYPGSGTHSSFISKISFIESLDELANQALSWYKNMHLILIFDYLDHQYPGEPKGIQDCIY